eukprot:gene13796-13917_t
MALRQPLNGGLPRRAPSPYDASASKGWSSCYVISLTVFTAAILATLVTFGVLNFLLRDLTLPPLPNRLGTFNLEQTPDKQQKQLQAETALTPSLPPALPPPALSPATPPRPAVFLHPFSNMQHIYTLPATDTSPRCQRSQICDGDHSCGPDGLGCVTAAKDRQDHVRRAIAWAWQGYRKFAWGHDEVDAGSRAPHVWFKLGLTIVDSLDTLLLAGLTEEYQQARHWVANHLVFLENHNVQFFEVNIRILGGLLSAYYLSDGDDLYLHKAQQLADRLMVAFNTSSGIPTTTVTLRNAEGRRSTGISDSQTNQAEAGTISMEFTTAGRLLGRDDMFDAGMQFWYVLMSTKNFSGLYCMGINTRDGECADAKMTIGSAADSMYEYMLKQWILSGHSQQVPLQLYKEAMVGVRKYLIRHIFDGTANMSIVSEAQGNSWAGTIGDTNDRFEHLTCFAGGMFVLGKLHNVSTNVTPADLDDITLGARIGRACYELYHQAASGVAPDSMTHDTATRVTASHASNRPATHQQQQQQQQAATEQALNIIPSIKSPTTTAEQPLYIVADGAQAAGNGKKSDATVSTASAGAAAVGTDASRPQRHLLAVEPSVAAGYYIAAVAEHHAGQTGRRRLLQDEQPARDGDTAPADGADADGAADEGIDTSGATGAAGEDDDAADSAAAGAPGSGDDGQAEEQDVQARDASGHSQLSGEQQATAPSTQGESDQELEEQEGQEQDEQAELQIPPPPPETSPPPPPPPTSPAGPLVATWTQLSHADFLRPEAIETLFYLWRATGDEIYREWGWNMFRGFERWCRLDSGGYVTLNDVNSVPPMTGNKMESFFVAETLKYFLLLFEDDPSVVPLDQWVFNTEAHPIPIWGTEADKKAMNRLKQRRRAEKLAQQQREAEQAALAEQAVLTANKGQQLSRPHDREGYGLGGIV